MAIGDAAGKAFGSSQAPPPTKTEVDRLHRVMERRRTNYQNFLSQERLTGIAPIPVTVAKALRDLEDATREYNAAVEKYNAAHTNRPES